MLLGNGDGTFQAPILTLVLPTSNATFSSIVDDYNPIIGDFNGDGRLDLLAGYHSGSSGVVGEVLLGNGNGTFQNPKSVDLGFSIQSIVTGDFNGDGKLDVALVVDADYDIMILLGIGNGTFEAPRRVKTGILPEDFTYTHIGPLFVGDFNGDGHLDLAASYWDSGNGRLISLGNGNGTFQAPIHSSGPFFGILAGDFNGDGRDDLVNTSSLLSQGNGLFVEPSVIGVNSQGNPLVANLDQDDAEDLMIVNQVGNILWRRGRIQQPGTFDPPITINPGVPSLGIAIIPSNRGPLVASIDKGRNSVSIFADQAGRFVRIASLPTGTLPAQIGSADLNGDRCADLVVRNAGDGSVSPFLGDGLGGFLKRPDVPIGLGASDIALADVDQSGTMDLVVTNRTAGDVRVLLNRGDATFAPAVRYRAGTGISGLDDTTGMRDVASLEATAGVAVAALTGSGPTDLVTINPGSNWFDVLAGLGAGRFANPVAFPTKTPARVVRVADFNRDGVSDLALLGAGGVSVWLGDGRGGFFRVADFNHDGVSDLALLGTGGVSVWLGDGRGGFFPSQTSDAPSQPFDAGPDPTGLTVADVNGDGKLDLLVGNPFGDVLVLLGNGDGTFQPYQQDRPADRAGGRRSDGERTEGPHLR